jgi:ubiquitin-protein ligase
MKFQTGSYALSQDAKATAKQEGRGRRVLNEILRILQEPIDCIEVYLQAATIFEWKTFIHAPTNTPYGNHILVD